MDTSYSSGEDYVIQNLEICNCPKLRMKPLPPRAIRLKISNNDNVLSSWAECTVSHTNASFSSSPVTTILKVEYCKVPRREWRLLQHLPGLTHLWISVCGDLTISPEILAHLSSLESLIIEAKDQEELPKWLGELVSLRELDIIGYTGIKELRQNMRQLTKLQALSLSRCRSITSLPHWLGELTSLKELDICECNGIRSLPEGIQQLANLRELKVIGCPELTQWCESTDNEKKLAHIKQKEIRSDLRA